MNDTAYTYQITTNRHVNTHSLQFKQYANTPVMCFGLFPITIQNGLYFRNVKLFGPQNQSA